MNEKPPELHPDILEAIAILTHCSPGDAFYRIEAGEFRVLAIEALKSFADNYYMMNRKDDTEPVDDQEILTNCLIDLQAELKVATDRDAIRELQQDINNIKQRIEIT